MIFFVMKQLHVLFIYIDYLIYLYYFCIPIYNIMSFISRFIKGNWMEKAKFIVSNPQMMNELLNKFSNSLSRQGLTDIKDYLLLMRDYLHDIFVGKYKGYHATKLILIVAAIIYIVTPIDFFPDLLPGGLIDDVTIALWVLKEVGDELERYKDTPKNSP